MLQRMSPGRARECAFAAAAHEWHNTGVSYPLWYLKRWHFLPEGYLSERCARAYDSLIRRVYTAGSERRLLTNVIQSMQDDPPGRVLEVGCAAGRALEALADAFPSARLTGVDLSPFLLDLAERRTARFGDQVTLIHGDAIRLPFEDGSFDAIYAAHLVGHLPRQAAERLVLELQRVIAPGGRLFLLDHSWHPQRIDSSLVTRPSFHLRGLFRLTVTGLPDGEDCR